MDKKIIALFIMVALSASIIGVGGVQAQGENDQEQFRELLYRLDTSIASLRKADSSSAKSLVSSASTIYQNNFKPRVENIDNALDNKIIQAFSSLSSTPVEENLFVLRADVSRAVSLVGVSLSPVYAYSMFIILGIAIVVSLLITFVTKRVVNWNQIRENRAKIDEFQKELREAQSKKDIKRIHKLQQRQSEIMRLQGAVMSQTMKPTIFYFIPLILLWTVISRVFGGWVVAWLPFNINLPIFGPLVAFGFGWWYFITYLGFSQIFRKILIRE